mgnify:FL=1
MKRISIAFLSLFLCVASVWSMPRPEYPRPQFERAGWVNLNGEWTCSFDFGGSGMEREFYKSKGFDKKITVPFCPESKLSGIGYTDFINHFWYQRPITIPQEWNGKNILLNFGAVYYKSEVYIDGVLASRHFGGTSSFAVDITSLVKSGQTHSLVVYVESDVRGAKQAAGKQNLQYASYGCNYTRTTGIWQTVWMEAVHPEGLQSVQLLTDIDQQQLVVRPRFYKEAGGKLQVTLKDNGKVVASRTVSASSLSSVVLPVKKMKTWSPESPFLYDLEYKVLDKNGNIIDEVNGYAGMRKVHIEGNKIYLNNKPYYQRLVLDQGFYPDGIWTAPSDEALKRDIELSMEAGFNGARLHQKVFEERFYYWADKMGYLTWGEASSWGMDCNDTETARNFITEWSEIVQRDRNHPSVFMWSIGNEVLEQWQHADADTLSLEAANLILNAGHPVDDKILSDTAMSVQGLIAHSLAAIVKRLDKTRPVTAANNEATPGNLIFRSNALDVLGFNYHEKNYEPFPQNFPGKTLIVSESTSALMTRGYYQMPSDSMYVWPNTWRERFDRPEHLCSAYDNCHVPWGSTHEVTWREVKRLPYVSGMFIWTGFDYLGEPTPYWWPSRSSFFGIVDLAGIPKDVYYMYQSEWTDTPVLHLFPHWNWKKGETVDVWAYYNRADEVELFLNGESLGVKSKPDDAFHVCWRVPFTPGTLKAVSRRDGKEVLTREIRTAGEPARIMLIPDRSALHADGTDLSFVTVEIQDKDGNLVPYADNLLRLTVGGDGFIAGTDNGDQNDPVSLKKPERHAFYGKAMAVIQNTGKAGTIRLKATAEGLPDAIVEIKVGE